MKLGKLKSAADELRSYVSTAWLKRLFPHTGEPDEFAHRLQRVDAAPLDVNGRQGGQVTCQFIYPEIDGSVQSGIVKFFLPHVLKRFPNRRIPLLHMAGYEIEAAESLSYLEEGIAVSTVHSHPLNVMSRGPKLEWALMHAMRRLTFVDDAQVSVKGICTGGNMALMTAVETFPLVCCMPIVPPLNLPYSLSYLSKSFAMASSRRDGSSGAWLPSIAKQQPLLEQAAERFGVDYEAPAYASLSPVWLVENITAPVLLVGCTGDLNVPVDQIGEEFSRPIQAADFPHGFTREISSIVTRPEHRVRLLDAIPTDRSEIFTVPIPKHFKKKTKYGDDFTGAPLEMPFSRSRQWSIAVIDDGAPESHLSHFKFQVAPDYTPFRHFVTGVGLQDEQLTPSKLSWLMKRYLDMQPMQFEATPRDGAKYRSQLLDFPQAERADVLRGLITYARSSDAAACRLAELHAALPENLKALGETIGTGSAESVRRVLAHASDANEA